MKKIMKSFSALLAGLLLLPSAFAGEKNSLLWEISGNGLKQPSYVFGTIHMICNEDYVMRPKVVQALNNSKQLVMEIDLTDTAAMMGMMGMMISTTPLSTGLDEKEKAELDELLQNKISMPLSMLEMMKPAIVYTMLATTSAKSSCDSIKVYEMEVMELAKKNQIPISGLETIEEQMDMLNEVITAKELLKMLKEGTVEEKEFDKLVKAYKNEDLETIDKIMNDEDAMNKKTSDVLLKQRNERWVEKIPSIAAGQPSFFAVGTGHLTGKNGVLELLRKKGYTLRAIMN